MRLRLKQRWYQLHREFLHSQWQAEAEKIQVTITDKNREYLKYALRRIHIAIFPVFGEGGLGRGFQFELFRLVTTNFVKTPRKLDYKFPRYMQIHLLTVGLFEEQRICVHLHFIKWYLWIRQAGTYQRSDKGRFLWNVYWLRKSFLAAKYTGALADKLKKKTVCPFFRRFLILIVTKIRMWMPKFSGRLRFKNSNFSLTSNCHSPSGSVHATDPDETFKTISILVIL